MSQHTPKQWFNLEERFFSEVVNQLLEKLRKELTTEQSAEGIMRVTGITDEKLAEEIASMQITAETLSAFRLVPLVAVAWADDRVEENERYAITLCAEKAGIAQDDAAMGLLLSWTKKRPPDELIDAWCDYAKALAASLNGEHRDALRKEVLSEVKTVAASCGGSPSAA